MLWCPLLASFEGHDRVFVKKIELTEIDQLGIGIKTDCRPDSVSVYHSALRGDKQNEQKKTRNLC